MATKKKSVATQIKERLFTQQDLAKLIGVSSATFTRKMQNNNFTSDEIKILQHSLKVLFT